MTSYSSLYNIRTFYYKNILARTIISALCDTCRQIVYLAATFLRIEETTCGKILKTLISAATLQ